MKLQKQLTNKDCYITCICNLLDLDNKKAPNFNDIEKDSDWWKAVRAWINSLGFMFIIMQYDAFYMKELPSNAVVIASGKSPYTPNVHHAVLWKDDKLFFDPKGGEGIIGDPIDITILAPIITDN